MIVRKPAVDAAALETWVAATPLSYPVSQWSIDGLDLWPLLSTALVSLAILDRIDAVTNHTKVGSLAWQAGVCVDYAAVSRLRKLATRRKALPLPSDRLDGRIVCCASQVHTRTIGEILVTAPLDVPALELQRAERACVYWFEDMSADDPRLDRVLLSPARGLDAIRTAIQNRAARFGLSAELTQLPKMRAWLRSTSEILLYFLL